MGNEAYEYTVDKKREGWYLLARCLMITLYLLFLVAFFVAAYLTAIQIFALAPIFLWMLVFFTWRFVSIEYKYTVEAGFLTLITVYGGKKSKVKARIHIKDATAFVPLDEARAAIRSFSPSVTYSLLSSSKSPKDAFALFTEQDAKKVLVLIEAPAPSVKAILYYANSDVKSAKSSQV
ncbi:MAG: hypothetical protein IKB38_03140 [Clostridia bacterium]|nr:hypothetical protein [Clostridia bacterium]